MNRKILCVDDEEAILKGFQLNLRKNFKVHLASDGVEGLKIFEENKDFAVVLSDMRMPRMDGATMLSEIKRDHLCDSSFNRPHRFQSAMSVNNGVFRMLSKPCPPETLIRLSMKWWSYMT